VGSPRDFGLFVSNVWADAPLYISYQPSIYNYTMAWSKPYREVLHEHEETWKDADSDADRAAVCKEVADHIVRYHTDNNLPGSVPEDLEKVCA